MDLQSVSFGESFGASASNRKEACGQSNARPEYEAVDCLRQLAAAPRWDGNLNSKTQRDRLVQTGLVGRTMGWNFLSEKGIEYCVSLGILRA